MVQAMRTFWRILVSHGIALAAWYLGGEALHQILVQVAGFVGGHTTLGGLLILPLAVAARLVSYIAMYLTVRPSLPHADSSHADSSESGGYREYLGVTLASILPFSVFYAAWGMLTADQIEFFNIASSVAFAESNFESDLVDTGGMISVGVLPVIVLVVALVVRVLHARFSNRLPAWSFTVAAYAELLWTFMLFTLVAQWWAGVREWIGDRAVTGWMQGIGDWFAANFAPVAVVWEGSMWLIGMLMAVLIVPAAWLAVAGVIYGTTFDSTPPSLRRGRAALRGTAAVLSRTFLRRFEDLWAAVAVIWRGGPLILGSFVLTYALWGLATGGGTRGILWLIGGHESPFWTAYLPLIVVGVAAIAEPLRVAIVATAYDAVIARPEAGLDADPQETDLPETGSEGTESEQLRFDSEADDPVIAPRDIQMKGTHHIDWDDIGEEDVVRE